MERRELGVVGDPPLYVLGGERYPLAHRRRLDLRRETVDKMSRQAASLVGADESGDAGQQRVVMFEWCEHLVVQALVILRFDSVAAERNSFGNEYPRPRVGVVVAELGTRHRNRKSVAARQRRELFLGLHLGASAVADGIGEVAGELDEQVRVQARTRLLIVDG